MEVGGRKVWMIEYKAYVVALMSERRDNLTEKYSST